jgi:hypothetical protein
MPVGDRRSARPRRIAESADRYVPSEAFARPWTDVAARV